MISVDHIKEDQTISQTQSQTRFSTNAYRYEEQRYRHRGPLLPTTLIILTLRPSSPHLHDLTAPPLPLANMAKMVHRNDLLSPASRNHADLDNIH